MNQVMTNIAIFIADHAMELTLGLTTLMVLAAFILLIVLVRRKPEDVIGRLRDDLAALANKQERVEDLVKDEMTANRKETAHSQQQARQELASALKSSIESLQRRMVENIGMQKDQLDSFSKQLLAMAKHNEERLEAMRQTIATQLQAIQQDNTRKLEQMRATVDEKLQTTLEKRLGESFKQVSERLEQVYKGLGEMRNLATGVGDLKKVLTNVKTRGTWGEIRLSHILEQILTPDQYGVNVATKKNSSDRVEFAIKLPGQDTDGQKVVWMPIDSKFPQEDYQRLLDAQEAADKKK